MRITTLLLALLLSIAAQAQAASGNLTYARPTTYADGSALPATSITGFEFRCNGVTGTTAGVSCALLTLPGTALAGAISVTVPLAGGTACIVGVTLVGTLRSADSNIACKTFAAVPPNPPGTVVVAQVQTFQIGIAVAYTETSVGARGSAVVGFVPLGTPCNGAVRFAYRGQDYRRVDKLNVVWWKTTPTDVVDAPCAAAI